MEPKQLNELASFAVAKYIWCSFIDSTSKNVCSNLFNEYSTYEWKNIIELEEFFISLCPNLPVSLRRKVIYSAILIGKYILLYFANY